MDFVNENLLTILILLPTIGAVIALAYSIATRKDSFFRISLC